jgi:hypothetical protein
MVKGISQNQMPDVTENIFCFSRSLETNAAKTQTDCSQPPDMKDFIALTRAREMNHKSDECFAQLRDYKLLKDDPVSCQAIIKRFEILVVVTKLWSYEW